MSLLDLAGATCFFGILAVIAGVEAMSDVLADLFARPDRRRHIAECSAREVGPPRLESYYLCEDAWSLPTGEPRGW